MTHFGPTTSTDEVLDGIDLTGKHMVITGASSGLGEESTRALSNAGARITMLARDQTKLDAARSRILAAVPSARLDVGLVDLSDLADIRRFTATYAGGPIDVLVNNAGVMAPPLTRTTDGFEMQFGTNHLGHFLLTNHLMDHLLDADAPRIVTLSSGGHAYANVDLDDPNFESTDYDPFVAYGRSKTANALFTHQIARRLEGRATAFSVHPGVIMTDLIRHVPLEALEGSMTEVDAVKSVEEGAATQVWAATTDDLVEHSGAYLADAGLGVEGGNPMTNGYLPSIHDDTTSAALWELSERLVGETFAH